MKSMTNKAMNVVVIIYVVQMGNNVKHHVQYITRHHKTMGKFSTF
jgi:hypothetical protein